MNADQHFIFLQWAKQPISGLVARMIAKLGR
jgi:hypothetical protein